MTNKNAPSSPLKKWSFIRTSQELLEKSKTKGEAIISTGTKEIPTKDIIANDNTSEAEPDVRDVLSSTIRPS